MNIHTSVGMSRFQPSTPDISLEDQIHEHSLRALLYSGEDQHRALDALYRAILPLLTAELQTTLFCSSWGSAYTSSPLRSGNHVPIGILMGQVVLEVGPQLTVLYVSDDALGRTVAGFARTEESLANEIICLNRVEELRSPGHQESQCVRFSGSFHYPFLTWYVHGEGTDTAGFYFFRSKAKGTDQVRRSRFTTGRLLRSEHDHLFKVMCVENSSPGRGRKSREAKLSLLEYEGTWSIVRTLSRDSRSRGAPELKFDL